MFNLTNRGRLAVSALALAVCAGSLLAADNQGGGKQKDDEGGAELSAHGRNPNQGAPTKGSTGALSPIINHGGPVMLHTPVAYLIWYGNWNQSNGSDTAAGKQLVKDFLTGLSNSPYFQINTTYAATGFVTLGSETVDTGSLGKRLSDNNIRTIVTNAINSGKLPLNEDGVYFVLTSSDIAKTGFCNQYCGWHTYTTIGTTTVKYSFVGNANRCLSNCAAQSVGPNGNAGVDGMLSVVAHELEESVSDPKLNAWYDSSGAENADKCAWTFGQSLQQASNGAYYNMTMNGKNYLIQRNLASTTNKCYVNWVTGTQ